MRGTGRPLSDPLRRLGTVDLALARLVEGHVNAALLMDVHGERPAREAVRECALLGVRGADAPDPLEWVDRAEGNGVASRAASAMRLGWGTSRSGRFDAWGLVLDEAGSVGRAGDLMAEPWFEGGVGRTCATHVGGAEGLIARRTELLRRMERLDDPVQSDRLGRALAEVAAAREAVDAATDGDAAEVERAVQHGLLAREAVGGTARASSRSASAR